MGNSEIIQRILQSGVVSIETRREWDTLGLYLRCIRKDDKEVTVFVPDTVWYYSHDDIIVTYILERIWIDKQGMG